MIGEDPELPPVSLTICSRNREEMLFETVQSVLQGDERPREIIVVDQSDTPHPSLPGLQPQSGCEIHYLWDDGRGVSRARNISINAAKYDIVVLTDDDMFVSPSWFGCLVRALLREGPEGVVTGQVLEASEDTGEGFAPSTKTAQVGEVYEGRVGKDVLFTGNMAMYRSVVDTVGSFDERLGAGAHFPAAYDNDFGFRILERGYRIHYVPEAVVHHRAWRSEGERTQLLWNYGRGQGAFYAKHLSLRDPYMLMRLMRDFGKSIVYRPLRSLWFRSGEIARHLWYARGLVSGLGEWLIKHRRKTGNPQASEKQLNRNE